MSATTTENAAFELKITRTFDAPRELVWKAWTDPEMSKRWMGPRGFQTTEFVMPMQAGSEWRRTMEGQIPGTEHMACLRQYGKTLEIVPPEKLVFTFAWGERSSVGLGESPTKKTS